MDVRHLLLVAIVWGLGVSACGGRSGLAGDDPGAGGTDAVLGTTPGGARSGVINAGGRAAGGSSGSLGGPPLIVDASGGPDAGARGPDGSVDASSDATAAPDALLECDPAIVTRSPASDSPEVPTSVTISVTFTCQADAASSQDLTLVLTTHGRAVEGESHPSADLSSVTFVPAHGLGLSTTYVAELQRRGGSLYSWSFTTRDGAWHDPETVGTVSGSDFDRTFAFAVNEEGSGVVGFSTNGTLSTRRFDIKSGLSPNTETVAVRTGDNDIQEVTVGIDDQRRATFGWREYSMSPTRGGQYVIYATTQDDGGSWGSVETMDGPAYNSIPDLFECDVDAKGRRILLVSDKPSGNNQIDLELVDVDHVTDTGPLIAGEDTGGTGTLGFEPEGNAWVVWALNSYGTQSTKVARLLTSGTWDSQADLGQGTEGGVARLAVARDGSVLLVFPAKVGDLYSLVARRFTPGNGWSPAQGLDTEGDVGTTSVTSANVAVDYAGNGLAVWTTNVSYQVGQTGNYDTRSEQRSQRFTTSGGWASTHETLDIGTVTERGLALDDAGNGFAVGVVETGEVRAARWAAPSGWQPSMVLGQTVYQEWSTPATHPRLIVTRDGRAVALWRNNYDLVIRRFDDQ